MKASKDRRGGGLAFLVKQYSEKHAAVVKLLTFLPFEAFEACIVYSHVSLTLVSLYRPLHSKQNKSAHQMLFGSGFQITSTRPLTLLLAVNSVV